MRFAFVRDGFHFWAFLLPPLWMLRHRLWLVLVGYLLVAAALQLALMLAGAPGGLKLAANLLLALLIGLEAASLRRFTLTRRGWTNIGVVVADDLELAERRFFDAWTGASAYGPVPVRSAAAAPPRSAGAPPEVIGLFPQPGARP
jgi:hypothetical protein